MANVRWNFRLGPLHFSSPVGVASVAVIVLCCCGSGIAGKFMDDPSDTSPPAVPVVETSAARTPAASPSAKPTPQAKSPAPSRIVTAGAYCHSAGEAGVTKAGSPMVCRGPGDLRWRRP